MLNSSDNRDALMYAKVLGVLSKIAMVLLVASYFIYIFWGDYLAVPPEKIASLWALPSKEVSQILNNSPSTFLDAIPLLCVMALSSISLICMSLLLMRYAKEKAKLRAALAFFQVCIIGIAMSGIANELF